MDSTASPLGIGNPAAGGAPRLSAAVKLNFGVGQVAEGVKTCSFHTFLFFYYSQVLGLSAALAVRGGSGAEGAVRLDAAGHHPHPAAYPPYALTPPPPSASWVAHHVLCVPGEKGEAL